MVLDMRDMEYGGRAFTCRDFEGHLCSTRPYDRVGDPIAPK